MNRAYVEIQDANTRIREMVTLQERVKNLESSSKRSLLDLDGTTEKISLGGLGGGMLLAGTLALVGWRKRKQSEQA